MISKLFVLQLLLGLAFADELTKDFCMAKIFESGAGEECGCNKMSAKFNEVRKSCGGKCVKETIKQTCCLNQCLFETITIDGKVNREVFVSYHEPIANVSIYENCVQCENIDTKTNYKSKQSCEIPSNILNVGNCVSWANLAKCENFATTPNCQKMKKLAQDCLELLEKFGEN